MCLIAALAAHPIIAALTVAAGAYEANSQVKQGQAQNRYYNALADNAAAQGVAQQAIDQKKSEMEQNIGSWQVKEAAVKGAEAQGQQRVAEAANGVAGSGTAQDIAVDSMRKTSQDEINLKYNADTKSWAFDTEGAYAKWTGDTQATQYRAAGSQALKAAKRSATVTLLSTAASVGMMGLMTGAGTAAATASRATTISPGAMGSNLMANTMMV